MQKQTSYLLYLPTEVLNKVRILSAKRKAENSANKTQKAILVEMIEIGLMMSEPSNATPTPHEAHSKSVENVENPKQLKISVNS